MVFYDGFNFNEYMVVNDIGRPILPPQTIYSKQIFGRSGAYYFDKRHEPIIIPITVTLYEDHNMTIRQMVRFLSGKLNKREPKPLIFSDEPNMYIDGILEGSTDLENIVKTGSGVLNFFCPDPFYYAINDEISTFHSIGDYQIKREQGNTESLPLIEIYGTNQGGIITIKTDTTEINYDGMLKSDEKLVLDSFYITSYVEKPNGERVSANDDIDTMIFPHFEVGDNSFSIKTVGGANINEVKVHARSRWT